LKSSRKTKRVAVAVAQPEASLASPPQDLRRFWPHILGSLGALVCAYIVYSPSLNGEFVFDDLHMPFVDPNAATWPLRSWLGYRPLLMSTYWANLHFSGGQGTWPYHAVNVFFHAVAAIFLFFVLRRLLDWTLPAAESGPGSKRDVLAAFGAAVFLLHPMQTEAVSYVAQRGENLGALFYFAAFCVFLYRKPGPVSWPATAAILSIYGAAVVTKEHTVTLPALLLLTDYFFNPGFTLEGIKRNWRLYLAVGIGALFGLALIVTYLKGDTGSVGFQLADFNAAQYLFTEFRVFFFYLALFLYPVWQTIDYGFSVSRTIFDHGSAIALGGIVLLTVAAFRYRRRIPLASYGFFAFCILLLPTSSIVPIKDPIADRRLYLPMFGLLLIAIEWIRRLRVSRGALIAILSCVCLLLASASYRRNEKWSNAVALWADAADKAPDKPRVQFGLGVAEFLAKKCHDSISHYLKAIALSKPDFELYMNLGMAYHCDGKPFEAIESLQKSIALKPTAQALDSLAMVEIEQGMVSEPLDAMRQAEALQPGYVMTYIYRGSMMLAAGHTQEAIAQFQRALDYDPNNYVAKSALAKLRP
jgi:protein O-mannosyl-transferase